MELNVTRAQVSKSLTISIDTAGSSTGTQRPAPWTATEECPPSLTLDIRSPVHRVTDLSGFTEPEAGHKVSSA